MIVWPAYSPFSNPSEIKVKQMHLIYSSYAKLLYELAHKYLAVIPKGERVAFKTSVPVFISFGILTKITKAYVLRYTTWIILALKVELLFVSEASCISSIPYTFWII